jgi:hypothetical protein
MFVLPAPKPPNPEGLASRRSLVAVLGVVIGSFTYTAQGLAQVIADPIAGVSGTAVSGLGLTGILTTAGVWMARKLIEERDARLADMRAQRDEYKRRCDDLTERMLADRDARP